MLKSVMLNDKPRLSLKPKPLSELFPGVNFSTHQHWSRQPKIAKLNEGWNDIPDLTGRRFGRLKVIGLYPEKGNTTRWVVRCSCGDYELRTTKAILNPNNQHDKCQRCHERGRAKHKQMASRKKL